MYLVKKTVVYIFYVLGVYAMWSSTIEFMGGHLDRPVTSFSLSINLLVAGFLTQKGIKNHYKGGASTVIGVLFIFLGLFAIGNSIDNYLASADIDPLENFSACLFFTLIGIVLVKSGHDLHKLKQSLVTSDGHDHRS